MARSYLPSKVSEIVALWRNDLNKVCFSLNIISVVLMCIPVLALVFYECLVATYIKIKKHYYSKIAYLSTI